MKGPSADILNHVTMRTTPAEFKQLLQERGEDINGYMRDQQTRKTLLVYVAEQYYMFSFVTALLLRCNADPNIEREWNLMTPLEVLISETNHNPGDSVQRNMDLLITYGANVNHLDYDGMSTLKRAVWARNGKMIEMLMDAGAVPDESLRYISTVDPELPYRDYAYAYAERVAARIRTCRRALCAFFVASSSGGGHKDTTRAVIRAVWERERRNRAWEEVAPLPGGAGEGSKN